MPDARNAERALWCAVLHRAVADACGLGGPNDLEKQQARNWLTADRYWLRQLCDWCQFDADEFVKWARRMENRRWPASEYKRAKLVRMEWTRLRNAADGPRRGWEARRLAKDGAV